MEWWYLAAYLNALQDNALARAGDVPAIERVIRRTWPTDADWAISIAWRESRMVPSARNPSGSSGLFQLLLPLHNGQFTAVGCSPTAWADPVCNAMAARHLYDGSGRAPWRL